MTAALALWKPPVLGESSRRTPTHALVVNNLHDRLRPLPSTSVCDANHACQFHWAHFNSTRRWLAPSLMWSYSVEDVDYIEHERLKVNKEADERSTCQHKQRQNKQDWAGPWHYPAILRTFPLIETQHNEVQNSKYR